MGGIGVTAYIVADRQSDPKFPAYLIEGRYPGLTADQIPTEWHWTSDRRKATRFEGRESAEAFARKTEAWIRINMRSGMKLSILPASGGVEITRKSAKESAGV